MLEVRVKQLEKQAHEDFRYSESLMAKLVHFLRKEVARRKQLRRRRSRRRQLRTPWKG
jgi:hypothetical protein